MALSMGLRYVYTVNIYDERSARVYCHGCGACVIERNCERTQ